MLEQHLGPRSDPGDLVEQRAASRVVLERGGVDLHVRLGRQHRRVQHRRRGHAVARRVGVAHRRGVLRELHQIHGSTGDLERGGRRALEGALDRGGSLGPLDVRLLRQTEGGHHRLEGLGIAVAQFEELRIQLKIPPRDAKGNATNSVTFGVQIQRAGRTSGLARQVGLGFFYDRGKLAVRVGGGRDDAFKDGELHRLQPEKDWPSTDWIELRIVRVDGESGKLAIYLDADPDDGLDPLEPVFVTEVGGFKAGTGGKAELWIGGYGTQAQPVQVAVRAIRIVRIKS